MAGAMLRKQHHTRIKFVVKSLIQENFSWL